MAPVAVVVFVAVMAPVVLVVDFAATVVLDVDIVAIVAAETAATFAALVERNWMHPEHLMMS